MRVYVQEPSGRQRKRRRRRTVKTDENTKRIKRAPRLIRLESEIKIGFLAEWSGPGNEAIWYCLQNETNGERERKKENFAKMS